MKTNQTNQKKNLLPFNEIMATIHSIKTPNATPTKTESVDFYALRNNALNTDEQEQYNIMLIDNIAVVACWSTLQFLIGQGATTEQATENINATKDEQKTPYGYNMAVKLLQDLPNDIAIFKTNNTDNAYLNSIDLIQEIRLALTPFVCSDIVINTDTVIYTKQLKNGNIKDYTLFKLACNTIRKYIQAQGQKQYKKLAYFIVYTDNNEPIYTTKKPKDDMNDITEQKRIDFLNGYGLTTVERDIMLHYINGLKVTDISPLVNMSFEATKKALYRAKQKIKKEA